MISKYPRLSATVVICLAGCLTACPSKNDPPPKTRVRTCSEGTNGVAGCVKIVQRYDTTGACEKPAADQKAQAWFFSIASDTPVEGDAWNFTLEFKKDITDLTGKLLQTTSETLAKPKKKKLEDEKFLISCRYASTSSVGAVPQYVTVSPICIGFANTCDKKNLGELVVKESTDHFP